MFLFDCIFRKKIIETVDKGNSIEKQKSQKLDFHQHFIQKSDIQKSYKLSKK